MEIICWYVVRLIYFVVLLWIVWLYFNLYVIYIESVIVINLIRENLNKNLMECEWLIIIWLIVKLK